MRVPRAIRRKIQSLQSRIRQSQRDSSWSGSASGSSFDLLPGAQTHHKHRRG